MLIKNRSQLLSEDLDIEALKLRREALNALEIALNAVKPENIVSNSVKKVKDVLVIGDDKYNLKKFSKIYIIGGGKATAAMAYTLERILKEFGTIRYEGIVNVPEGLVIEHSQMPRETHLNFASHPIPNESGFNGVKSMMELIKKATKNDLIFCLISGGGSALLPLPKEGISLPDLKVINDLLLASGASISQINTIRKHLSDIKGGNLAKYIYNTSGAKVISLIISDVIGDSLDIIASGPTVADSTTYEDAFNILKKFNLLEKAPSAILDIITRGIEDKSLETPKNTDICFSKVHNYLIGTVKIAVKEIIERIDRDFEVFYFSDNISGEARDFASKFFQIVSQKVKEHNISKIKKKGTALIGTGELTVTIRGKGIGGRNQEFLLNFLELIKNREFPERFVIISANLDGIEGNSKAMGALIDNHTFTQMITQNLDSQSFLGQNDSNTFFKRVKSEIVTGPTGCNVNDLTLALIHHRE